MDGTRNFTQRLNKVLDDLDVPSPIRDRAVILSKMLNIPKQQAWAILEGKQSPDESLLQLIATELEVDPAWLVGDKN